MNLAGIYHRPESEMAYLYTKDVMHIRLKTAQDDITQVLLLHGDPYSLHSRPDLPKFYKHPTPMKKFTLMVCMIIGRQPLPNQKGVWRMLLS
jgi:Alpha amylase, N-terminal ig-like domain.